MKTRIDEAIRAIESAADISTMTSIVEHFQHGAVTDEQIACLARALAHSGHVIHIPADALTADVASTGGPSSLTTLLCPLFLRCLGAVVPKLGVPGRPAGAVDVMAQIPGYRIDLSESQVADIIDACGYAHCIASSRYTPLDAALFEFRRTHAAIAVPSLAIASLLAKKIAMDVRRVGLDIRVSPHGNFGRTWDEARRNARCFIQVAELLGITAKCFLSNASEPCQPYIGRSEALRALLDFFSGDSSDWLDEHIDRCFLMAALTLGRRDAPRPSAAQIRKTFQDNLSAQGGSYDAFIGHVRYKNTISRQHVTAMRGGFFEVDLRPLRDAIQQVNETAAHSLVEAVPFPDLMGITLCRRPGQYVSAGAFVAEVRSEVILSDYTRSLLDRALRFTADGGERYGFEEV